MMKKIPICLLFWFYTLNFSITHAAQEPMHTYLRRTYQEICHDKDEVQRTKKLKLLLIETQHYYQGLLPTPDPMRHAYWLMISLLIAQNCSSKGFVYYLCCVIAIGKATELFNDACRFIQKDKIRERFAQLEGLMAGIQAQLS